MSSHHHHHDLTTLQGRAGLMVHKILKPYKAMSKRNKMTFWIVLAIHVVALLLVIIITPHRIGQWFNNAALAIRGMGWKGVLVLGLAVIISSHPPLFGFSASMSMFGFAYGLWKGLLFAGIASLIGASLAWFSIRTFFLDWMRRFGSSKNKQWEAFGRVMRDKGWPLVVMIRWCPLPWAIGNGLFASIEGIEYWQFMLANVTFIPRLLIPVFIGSRLESMTGDEGEKKPDPLKFWINLGSITLSICISIGTGLVIYRLTLAQMRRLEGDDGEEAAEALEQTALLGDYSDDDDVQEELVPRQSGYQV